jgi:hypothetical protein
LKFPSAISSETAMILSRGFVMALDDTRERRNAKRVKMSPM